MTATSCHLRGGENGFCTQDGGYLIGHTCTSSDNSVGYLIFGGIMELLNCSSEGDDVGCVVEGGHLAATNVAVTNSDKDGFYLMAGKAELTRCSAKCCHGDGMLFEDTEARVQDCTVDTNSYAGFAAMGTASVAVRGVEAERTVIWGSMWGATRR